MSWTDTELFETSETDVLEVEERAIVLYNDEVNTFDHVIDCLMKYCGHDAIQAEQCAWITHLKGKCKVKQGEFEKLLAPCDALQQQGLSATIE